MSLLTHHVEFYRKHSDKAEARFGVFKCLIGNRAIPMSFHLRREGFLDTQSFPLAEESHSLLTAELLQILASLFPSYFILPMTFF